MKCRREQQRNYKIARTLDPDLSNEITFLYFMSSQDKSVSKFLSLILRHKPETIQLTLDENGWAQVDELITKANRHNVPLTSDSLTRIVETNDKKRFTFSEDGKRIRASQGHSIPVDLQLTEGIPPPQLFHGTALKNLGSIKRQGLLKGRRHHVHLSADRQTAKSVGARYGKPAIITINAEAMHRDRFLFFQTQNGVWLTETVPARYLEFEPPG
jgi:putative RNA 2'-phosphotransferase